MSRDLIRIMQALFLPHLQECQTAGWWPAADVYRTSDGWLIKLDVAGVRMEDIRIEVQGQRLTVSGSRRDCNLAQGCRHQYMEIAYSEFHRGFELPGDLQQCSISTDYRDGMLHIYIKTEKAR